MALQIVNNSGNYVKPALIENMQLGYIYIAATISPAPFPFVLPNEKRSRLLKTLQEIVSHLKEDDRLVQANVFRAIVKPPTINYSKYLKRRKQAGMKVADYDVMVLIQTRSPDAAIAFQQTALYAELKGTMEKQAKTSFTMTAYNVKHIADFDLTPDGLYLFNHFAAENEDVMLELWDYLADWYMKETGLTNSVGMAPLRSESSDYVIVNWAKWNSGALHHFWNQLSKRSFWKFVTVNLEQNDAGSMPVYCRLV